MIMISWWCYYHLPSIEYTEVLFSIELKLKCFWFCFLQTNTCGCWYRKYAQQAHVFVYDGWKNRTRFQMQFLVQIQDKNISLWKWYRKNVKRMVSLLFERNKKTMKGIRRMWYQIDLSRSMRGSTVIVSRRLLWIRGNSTTS